MPQLYFSVDDETARRLAAEARARGVSLSKYLASIVARERPSQWPPGYLKSVLGACRQDPLEEPSELPLDDVDLEG